MKTENVLQLNNKPINLIKNEQKKYLNRYLQKEIFTRSLSI